MLGLYVNNMDEHAPTLEMEDDTPSPNMDDDAPARDLNDTVTFLYMDEIPLEMFEVPRRDENGEFKDKE